MKIAVLVNTFPALSETFILNQITGLLDRGHEVWIFAWEAGPHTILHEDVQRYQLLDRTHYLHPILRSKGRCRLQAIFFVMRKLFTCSRKTFSVLKKLFLNSGNFSYQKLFWGLDILPCGFDIVYVHFGNLAARMLFLKELEPKLKFVVMFHGIDIRLAQERGGEMYRDLFDRADRILTNSQYTANCLLDWGARQEKVCTHPVGIDPDRFRRGSPAAQHPPEEIQLVTVARLVGEKGISYALQALRLVLDAMPTKNIHYKIAGDGPLKVEFESLMAALYLEKYVTFVGAVSQNQVCALLEESDIFLLPSVREAFGLVLLEAQAMELPIVATDTDGIPEAVLPGQSAQLVPPKNPEAMAQAIMAFIQDKERCRKMGITGRRFVTDRYNIQELNERLVKLFEELLDS